MHKFRRRVFLAFLAVVIVVYSLIPLYWCFRTSLMSKPDLLKSPPNWLPFPATLDNFAGLLGFNNSQTMLHSQFAEAFANSLIICVVTTVAVCLIAIFAGYVFARWQVRGSNFIFGVLMATMVLPAYSVMIPLYRIITNMGLMDTITGIVFIYMSAFLPLAVWLMRNFFSAVPREIEEAAMIDGAGRFRCMLTLIPMALPGILAVAIITFLSAWSQYAIPLVFASSDARPLTVFLSTMVGKTSIHYGLMSAGGILSILPPILVVVLLNKYLIGGLMKGIIR
jgi:multiple sugar transport system permease protein